MIIAISILFLITFAAAVGLLYGSHLHWKHTIKLFIAGTILFLILNGFLYSIGKSLSIDIFFFELRIIGKNGLADFEYDYLKFIKNLWYSSPILFSIGVLIAPACIEEIWKLLMLIQSERKNQRLQNTSDAIFSMSFIAVGFACAETITYLVALNRSGGDWLELLQLSIFRSILSTASHIVFSSIVWFFYGRALFAGFTIIDHGGITKFNRILKWIKKVKFIPISSIKTLYQVKLMFLGFAIAIPLHITYNYLLQMGNIPLAYLIVWGGGYAFFWYTKQLEKKECNYQEIDHRILYLIQLKYAFRSKKILNILGNKE